MEDSVAFSRRSIVKAGVTAMGTAALAPLASCASLAPLPSKPANGTLVTALYKSLSDDQRKVVCFSFDDPQRRNAGALWFTPKAMVGTTLSLDQQEMVRQIFIGLHNPDFADRVMGQVVEDNGSFGNTAIGFFGKPGSGKFEFVQTGLHVTRRCDDKGMGFGGPIHYGHSPGGNNLEHPGHPGDAYFYQARQASQVFKMLDGKQRTLALVDKDPGDYAAGIKLSGKTTGLPGIAMTELSRDQKEEVRKTLATVLSPFHKADADEAMKMVQVNGFDNLHMAFYKSGNLDTGDVWNMWQIEGPAMRWCFHGIPHVHVWVNIRPSVDV